MKKNPAPKSRRRSQERLGRKTFVYFTDQERQAIDEAASLERWTLSRRHWRQLDIVVADDEEAAERRFFDRWTAQQRGLSNDQPAVDRGAPPPTRDIPGQGFSRPPPLPRDEIIGLFPEPGASR